MTLKKFVTGWTLLSLIFVGSVLMVSCYDGGGLEVPGAAPPPPPPSDGPGLVVAVWGRFLTQATSDALKTDFEAYCTAQSIAHGTIEFRWKAGPATTDTYYEVAAFGASVLADGNVNIVLPVGSNITTGGGVTVIERKALAPGGIGDITGTNSTNRLIGYLTDDALTAAFYSYVDLPQATAILAVDRRTP